MRLDILHFLLVKIFTPVIQLPHNMGILLTKSDQYIQFWMDI